MTHHFDIHVPEAPGAPLDAAQWFYKHVVPTLRPRPADERTGSEDGTITIVFANADHTHRAWRLAAVQELAREVAPVRLNAIAGDDDAAISEALDYLHGAAGVTGQLLSVQPG